MQVQDLVKDFATKNYRLATVRAVKHHCQYLSQLKAMAEGRGIHLVSDTGMGAIMRVVLVGCVQIDNPAARQEHTVGSWPCVPVTQGTVGPVESICESDPSGDCHAKTLRNILHHLR